MLCQQHLISQQKYMVMTQQKYADQQEIWQVSEMSWFSKKYAVSAKTCWVIKMPDDNSTKDSWVRKNLLSQQKSADSAKYAVPAKLISPHKYLVMTEQKYAVSAKICQVREMIWFSKNTLCAAYGYG